MVNMSKTISNYKQIKLYITKLFVIFAISIFSHFAYAQEWVIDNAHVLDNQTKSNIEETLRQLNSRTGSKSFIVTERVINQSEQVFADDMLDQLIQYKTGQNIEGTLLLVVTEDAIGQGRRVYISTSGDKTINLINDRTIDQLTSKFADDMRSSNDYNKALSHYVTNLDKKHDGNSLSGTDAAGGGLAGLLSGLLAFFRTKKRYRLPEKPIPAVWKNNTINRIARVGDQLIDSQTRIRMIPTPQRINNGGGSTTHYSSSGNRHGGGGRGF
ncbi:MAG: TPM domain-containing protein [Neisseriaceae bacterium]|nr:TPM domain-containing protein [Neisseriaceae bacterium]